MGDDKIRVGGTGEYLNTNRVTTDAGEVHNEVIDQGNIVSSLNSRERVERPRQTLAPIDEIEKAINSGDDEALTLILRHFLT